MEPFEKKAERGAGIPGPDLIGWRTEIVWRRALIARRTECDESGNDEEGLVWQS